MPKLSAFILVFTVLSFSTSRLFSDEPVAINPEWSQFRGPNGSGFAKTGAFPIEFGKGQNMQWMAPLPPGHSSPVLHDGRIYLTASENESFHRLSMRAVSMSSFRTLVC